MTTIQKLKEILENNKIDKKIEINKAFKIRQIMNEPYPFISSVNLEIMIDILNQLGLSETEKTEIIAYYYNKTLNFYNRDKKNESIYNLSYKQTIKNQLFIGLTYEEQCNKLNLIRMVIDENGNILPAKISINEEKIKFFKTLCCISGDYVIKILKLSLKKYNDILKKESIRERSIEELFKKLFPNDVQDHYYSPNEIADIKNRMLKLEYNAQEIEQIIDNILKTNQHIEKKESKSSVKQITEIDYKLMKNLTHELKQFIGDDHKPYDYLTDDQINLVITLMQKLGYSKERKNTILNNIKKHNKKIMQDENQFQLEKTREDVFRKIDSKEDKPFTALSLEIYELALKNETKLDDLTKRINGALAEIQNSIIKLVDSNEEQDFYIEYIMEALNEIDQCFAKANEWNLIKERKK